MKFRIQFVIVIAVQFLCTAFSFAGSFAVQDRMSLASNVDCDDVLAESAKVLLPEKLDKLVQYYSVVCDPVETPMRELAIEAVYESHDEEDEAALAELFNSMEKSVIQGKVLSPVYLRDVFLNIYHYALKQQDGQWQTIGGFESPQGVECFSLVYAEKNKLKSFLKNGSDQEIENYLLSLLGGKTQAEWQQKILPEMQKLQLNFYIYLVAQDGRVLKSNLRYQLER